MSQFEHYVRSGNKNLRMGYTTGTCASLAAGAAARYALSGEVPAEISVMTVKGIPVTLEPHASRQGLIVGAGEGTAFDTDGDEKTFSVSVIKDAGDDADATNGIEVWASVTLTDVPGIEIDGGFGVGRVTKPGLDQPVGNAAINSTPRRMIRQMVEEAIEEYGYEGGAKVIISIPEGIETAKKTFNPMLGIEGGISVIGTSGIVEPMSEQALVDTIEVTLRQALSDSKDVILTPGNYGERFLMKEQFDRYGIPVVKCSNFLGEALDCAAVEGAETVLLVGHIGKLSKVAAGVMNTHSRYADARREVFTAHAVLAGADRDLCAALMDASTTDACLDLLEQAGLKEAVMERILKEIQAHLEHRVREAYRIGAVVFSNEHGLLGMTDTARTIIEEWDSKFTD